MLAIRPFDEDDYPGLVAARNAIWPGRAQTSDGLRHLDEASRVRGMPPFRVVALEDGRMVGFGSMVGLGEAHSADVGVVPAARRRGIGRALWARVEAELRERGVRVARTGWIDEPDDGVISFLQKHCFRERERAWGLSLDLGSFDPAQFADPADMLAATGIGLTNLTDEGVDDLSVLRRVHALHNACRRDQPPPEDHLEPIPFDFWITRLIEAPGALPDAFFLAKHGGEYVGMSLLERDGPVGVLQSGFTGVLPLYRGRGIARALKLRAIAYAREHGFRELRTGNHSGNGPILRVNEILGFRKTMARVRFEKELSPPGV